MINHLSHVKPTCCFRYLTVFLLFSFFGLPAHAASLHLQSAEHQYPINEQFSVEVVLNASNALNQTIVLADAVIQYETDMLELISIDTSSAQSDFYYNYTLSTNSFPLKTHEAGVATGLVQVVVGVPSAQAIAQTNTNVKVASVVFRTKQPPASRVDFTTPITLVFDSAQQDYTQSKVVANDGLGSNVLDSVAGLSIQVGDEQQVPLPIAMYAVLALLLLGIGFRAVASLQTKAALLAPVVLSLALSFLFVSNNLLAQNYDLTGDGAVDSQDVGVLLSRWLTSNSDADFNNSGSVDDADLDLLLNQFNTALTPAPPATRSNSNGMAYSRTYHDANQAQVATETVDGERSDVDDTTKTHYDTAGNITVIANALGHTVHMQNYNARGQVGQIIDANNIITELAYHPRGWLEQTTVKHPIDSALDAVTVFDYDAVGQITQITLPDNSYLIYEYDDSRRLTAIENTLGERIEYTLDNAGNRTTEVICLAGTGGNTGNACNIQRTQNRVFDALSRLRKDIGAQSQTYRYDYDSNDNLETQTDAKSYATAQSFDGLDRLTTQVEPDNTPADNTDNPTIQYTYDSQDRIKTVTDQRDLITTYNYDAFGSLTSVDSPDTGLTTYTYDDAGNRTSQTDARGQVTYYYYDALNRLTNIVALNAPSEQVTYVYDDNDWTSPNLVDH